MFFGNTVVRIIETLKILSRTCYCVIAEKKWLLHWGKDGFIVLLDFKDAGWEEGVLDTYL